jgi:hypothetical protein
MMLCPVCDTEMVRIPFGTDFNDVLACSQCKIELEDVCSIKERQILQESVILEV